MTTSLLLSDFEVFQSKLVHISAFRHNPSHVLNREEGSAFANVNLSVRHKSHLRVQPLKTS